MNTNIIVAVLLTLAAGLSTGIGGMTVFFQKKASSKVLAFTLGISAGVMLYISFVELFAKANSALGGMYGEKTGAILTVLSFFCGIGAVALVNRLIPENGEKLSTRSCATRDGMI